MKKILGTVLTFVMLVLYVPCTYAAELKIGDYLQMGTYYDAPILWRCVDIDENGPLMLSDKIICVRDHDADGSGNVSSGSHSRRKNGNRYASDYWGDSTIRSWLNSSAKAGEVEWLCGNSPDDKHTYLNAYDDEAGFLTNFHKAEYDVIKSVYQKSILSPSDIEIAIKGKEEYKFSSGESECYIDGDFLSNYEDAYCIYLYDKMFLLDVKQLKAVYDNGDILGNDYYKGRVTEQCTQNDVFYENIEPNGECNYWLRTPGGEYNDENPLILSPSYLQPKWMLSTHTGGTAFRSQTGVRPAFYISDIAVFSGSGTITEPYTINKTTSPTDKPEIKEPCFTVSGRTVTNTGDTQQKVAVIVADYTNGVLTDIFAQDVTFAAGQSKSFSYGNGSEHKIFVWDSLSGMKPLCKSE